MEIILLLIACFGLTNILVNSKIMEGFREKFSSEGEFFKDLISCSMCTGFWVGLYFALIIILAPLGSTLFYIATLPFASSGLSWIMERGGIILDCLAHKMDKE
jgi:hypothetical protein